MKSASLILLLLVATSAQAMTAFLVSSRVGTSVTGMSINVCTYSYNGNQFEQAYPLGQMCPMSVEVN